jgi:hypothetical protein
MVAKISALLAISLLACAGCQAKVNFKVPEGWQVRRTVESKDGASSNVLAPADGTTAWIIVVCSSAKQDSPKQAYLNIKRSLDDEGAQIIGIVADPDWTNIDLAFAIDTEDGPMHGRATVKLDSGGHQRLLNVQGLWPADRDAEFNAVFDAVAASADFR